MRRLSTDEQVPHPPFLSSGKESSPAESSPADPQRPGEAVRASAPPLDLSVSRSLARRASSRYNSDPGLWRPAGERS